MTRARPGRRRTGPTSASRRWTTWSTPPRSPTRSSSACSPAARFGFRRAASAAGDPTRLVLEAAPVAGARRRSGPLHARRALDDLADPRERRRRLGGRAVIGRDADAQLEVLAAGRG